MQVCEALSSAADSACVSFLRHIWLPVSRPSPESRPSLGQLCTKNGFTSSIVFNLLMTLIACKDEFRRNVQSIFSRAMFFTAVFMKNISQACL